MTIPNFASVGSKSTRPTWLSGCLTIFAVLLGILGIWNMVLGLPIIYISFSVPMLSPAIIALMLIIAGNCLIYFILAFRIKRQNWLISLALLAVVWLVLPLALYFLINIATMRVRIDGYAMESALPNGSYILADRQVYQQLLPQRGDVVIFSSPDSAHDLVKRIIGLPGEVVTINQGQVSIDGTPLNEPYISAQATYSGEWQIAEGHYFVLGDNRPDSRDSHSWGLLPREYILGKAVWIYWPLMHFGEIVDIHFVP